MLDGEAAIAQSTMIQLQGIEDLEEIAIYRVDGKIAFSDYSTIERVNTFLDFEAFERTPRTPVKTIESDTFDKAVEEAWPAKMELVKNEEMEYFYPLVNSAECADCHDEPVPLRGVAHFKISIAGINQQIRTARTIFTILFISTGVVIAFVLIMLMRGLIISPILKIGKSVTEVGKGNLETRISIQSKDELGDLGVKINEMIVGLDERNRLLVENKIIEATNKENRKYLDNIQEGLLLIDPNFSISDQYSKQVIDLFGTRQIAGKNFIDFIYRDRESQMEEREELEQFLTMLFNQTMADIEMIMEINPLKDKTLQTGGTGEEPGDKKEITVDTLFHRIVDEDRVENVMVIFEDKTEIVATQKELEKERVRSQSEIEYIAAILRAGPQSFNEFIEEADAALNEIELHQEDLKDNTVINKLFRQMHSLKGTARYLEFRRIATLAHEIEDIITEVRDSRRDIGKEERSALEAKINDMFSELDEIKQLNDRFRSFSQAGSVLEGPEKKNVLTGFLESLGRMAADIAKELDKEINYSFDNTLGEISYLGGIKNAIIHLVRNAVDHGIEDQIERLGNNKNSVGKIQLKVSKSSEDQHVFEIMDDGRGIDFELVRKKALEKGLIKEGDKTVDQAKLLKILFMPSFSSKGEVTNISGRGVGLDLVKDSVDKLRGRISVSTKKNRGTRISIKIPQTS
jgi:nitrogen fixation/metabolism regulation signal transduction histidine kinase